MANHYNRGRKLPGETFTADEVKALLLACNRGATGTRNRALIALLWRGGLRCAEALGLYPADLDPRAGLVRIKNGKGGKQRTVGLDYDAFAALDDWLSTRRLLGLDGRRPLFCTLQGRPLDSSYVRHLLPRLAKRAGIQKRVHAHGLRHTHAVEMLRDGGTLPKVQAQLGHSSLSVTSRYLAHVTPEDLADFARSRPRWDDEPRPDWIFHPDVVAEAEARRAAENEREKPV